MSIIRIYKKAKNFLILDKTCLDDNRLSWKAKGLHAYLMSRPDNWRILVKDLVKRSTEGRDALYAILKELERFGYITRHQERHPDGSFGQNDYIIHEVPLDPEDPPSGNPSTPTGGKDSRSTGTVPVYRTDSVKSQSGISQNKKSFPVSPLTANPLAVKPLTVKPTLLNNKNTNYQINKISNAATEPSRISDNSSSTQAFPEKLAAADCKKCEGDESNHRIGSRLTPEQQAYVKQTAEQLSQNVALPIDQLEQAMTECLLNPHSFTLAGQDFFKKLNTIKKSLRQGKFVLPAPQKPHLVKFNPETEKIQRLQELYADRAHWIRLWEMAQEQNKSEERIQHFYEQIVRCDKLIQAFMNKRGDLLKQIA